MTALKNTLLASAAALALAGPAAAEGCDKITFSDVGWTDITATTAAASEVLKGLGYSPEVQILSVPVTYASLKNKDIELRTAANVPEDDVIVTDLGADLLACLLDKRAHGPVSRGATDAENEVFEQLAAARRVHNLGMELQSKEPLRPMLDGRVGRVLRHGHRLEAVHAGVF